jgi:hypothetical protein
MPYGFPAAASGTAKATPAVADFGDMSRYIAPLLTVSAGLLLAGCSVIGVRDPSAVRARPVDPPDRESMVLTIRQLADGPDTTTGTTEEHTPSDLVAVGFASITAQSGSDPAQRRLQAARAAKLDAYRNLAEQIYGVEFASDSIVTDSRVIEDNMRVRISGLIAGAEIVALEPLGNDSYQATVRLPAHKVAALQRQ